MSGSSLWKQDICRFQLTDSDDEKKTANEFVLEKNIDFQRVNCF